MSRLLKRYFRAGALGDMLYVAADTLLTAVGGTKATGKVPVLQSDGTVAWATPVTAAAAFVALADGATITWATAGARENNAKVTIAGNRTLSITGAVDGASGTLIVTQDATGGRTLTLPSGTVLGTVTSIGTTASKKTAVAWLYDGAVFYFWFGRET